MNKAQHKAAKLQEQRVNRARGRARAKKAKDGAKIPAPSVEPVAQNVEPVIPAA